MIADPSTPFRPSLKPYPRMKGSGVPWLGQVPEDWEVRKLKHAVTFSGGGTPSKANATFWSGSIPWVSPKDMQRAWITDTTDHITPEAVQASATSIVPPGALLVVVRSGILRRAIPVAINAVDVALNQDMKALRPRRGLMAQYLLTLVQGNEAALIAEWTKQGATVESIEHELLANAQVPLPPLPEQSAIVRFLDHVDRRIRRYIRAKQKLVKLLEEEKQAVIHRAVTRGLDPDVRLKPSGVEWLGQVPLHWCVASLRFRYEQCLGKMVDAKKASGRYPIPYLRNVDVRWDEINTRDLPVIDVPLHERDRYCVRVGDLLVCEGRHLGRSAFWNGQIDVCGFQKALHRLRPLDPERDIPRYLFYCMRLAYIRDAFGRNKIDNTIPHLTGEMLRAHRFAFPPVDEQRAIAAYLDSELARIQSGAGCARSEISLLREYRTRLIADVVTGKLDVREAAARLPDEAEEPEPLEEEDGLGDGHEDTEEAGADSLEDEAEA